MCKQFVDDDVCRTAVISGLILKYDLASLMPKTVDKKTFQYIGKGVLYKINDEDISTNKKVYSFYKYRK